MKWNVRLSKAARNQWLGIKDSRIREQLRKHIRGLENEPARQGKPLEEDLYGYRSIKAVKQRYRIIYKVKNAKVMVLVVGIGIRKDGDKKDVYRVAIRLAKLGLLDIIDIPNEDDESDESNDLAEGNRPEIDDKSNADDQPNT